MSSNDNNRRYLKRKSKIAQRPMTTVVAGPVKAYSGQKYQQDEWAPLMCATELAIYETIQLTDSQLSNDTVKSALTKLVLRLEGGVSPALTFAEPQPEFVLGKETEFLIWNIRRRWARFVEAAGPVDVKDLEGILRTLLYSIKAHQWNSGKEHGYVAFLPEFLEEGGFDSEADVEELRAGLKYGSENEVERPTEKGVDERESGSIWKRVWSR